jgi:RNA polymerase sigma-70 factor, ECF subfamily
VSFNQKDDALKIVTRVQSGDVDAFGELVSSYQKRIFNFCFRLLLNRADAEDAAQETFIKAFRAMKSFKGESKFSTWLYVIAKNTCFDKFKSRPGWEFTDELVADPKPMPEEVYYRKEREALLLRALDKLDEMHRVALNLVHFEGLSYEEASHIMGCEVGTVKSRVSRGMEKLGKLITVGIKENKGKA